MTNIFLGEPPANVKQWIIDSRSVVVTVIDETYQRKQVKVPYSDSELTIAKLTNIDPTVYFHTLDSVDKIPAFVTSISFSGCYNLMSITIPSTVVQIGNRAFVGCSAMGHIDIPSSVTTIGEQAFQNSYLLEQLNIPSSVTTIGDGAFAVHSDFSGRVNITLNGFTKTQTRSIVPTIFSGSDAIGYMYVTCSDGKLRIFKDAPTGQWYIDDV